MITMTTYGSWLRGDARGWVEDGVIYPADPPLEDADRARMKHAAFRFAPDQLPAIGQWIGDALVERLDQPIYAMTVQTWHVHVVVGPTPIRLARIAKCAKDAVRWGLRPGRPIWAEGYDQRFCFDAASAAGRIGYVAKHNLRTGWPARPWAFIVDPI